MIYLLPFVCLEERGIIITYHLSRTLEETASHGDVSIAADRACEVSSSIDVMVDLELSRLVVILRRVYLRSFYGSRHPCALVGQPVRGHKGIAAIYEDVGIACNISRGDTLVG